MRLLLLALTLVSVIITQSSCTTSGPPTCGGYCESGKANWAGKLCVHQFQTNHYDYNVCMWAFRYCCPPNGDGSQWTTTTTTSTIIRFELTSFHFNRILKHWKIILIVVGVLAVLAIIGGIGYFLYKKICRKNKSTQENVYNPPAGETAGANYVSSAENPDFGDMDDFYDTEADTTYYP